MRFSLRTLLIAVALFAILLTWWLGYRHAKYCQLRWLSPGSAEAKSLFPAATIETLNDGSYRFRYYARSCDIQALIRGTQPTGDYTLQVEQQSVVVKSPDLTLAKSYLKSLQARDKIKPGTFVIRGRVVDRRGRPVAHATIDLMGGFALINYFETRDDATFTMPLTDSGGMAAPPGSGYYLRVRTDKDSAEKPMRWNTPGFSLSPDMPEREAVIVIPQTFEKN